MRTELRIGAALLVAATALGAHAPLQAATITGRVATPGGQPVAGALVTLWNGERNRKETVYTDAAGDYRLETAFKRSVLFDGFAEFIRSRRADTLKLAS